MGFITRVAVLMALIGAIAWLGWFSPAAKSAHAPTLETTREHDSK